MTDFVNSIMSERKLQTIADMLEHIQLIIICAAGLIISELFLILVTLVAIAVQGMPT